MNFLLAGAGLDSDCEPLPGSKPQIHSLAVCCWAGFFPLLCSSFPTCTQGIKVPNCPELGEAPMKSHRLASTTVAGIQINVSCYSSFTKDLLSSWHARLQTKTWGHKDEP